MYMCCVYPCMKRNLSATNPLLSSQSRTFSVNCTFVNGKIAAQMNAWSGTSCGTGEKCRYKVTGRCGGVTVFLGVNRFTLASPIHTHTHTQISTQTANEIKGTHTTPVHHYVDDLTMAFTASGSGCSVAVSYQLVSGRGGSGFKTSYQMLHTHAHIHRAFLPPRPGTLSLTMGQTIATSTTWWTEQRLTHPPTASKNKRVTRNAPSTPHTIVTSTRCQHTDGVDTM